MNCSRCNRELTEDQSYVYQGKVFCENCLMDVGLSLKECDPWSTYTDTSDRKRHGQTGSAGLNEMEARVYEFVKSKGEATREEIMEQLGMSRPDLEAQLIPLMHSELLKERSKNNMMYLVPIG
ncbi:MAG: helix-turn-helix domain-containing protein [Dehalococcoidales bacterium]|nr:helix-turn-helix domain-containing protein [Dehalococcoidales bacterium]